MARNNKPDAVLCTLHFDESRMFNLLHAWRQDSDLSLTPFICCAFTGLSLPGEILLNMEVAVRVLGGCDFIDLVNLPEDLCRTRLTEVIDRSDMFCRLSQNSEKAAVARESNRLFSMSEVKVSCTQAD
jgi:hypothetical protein